MYLTTGSGWDARNVQRMSRIVKSSQSKFNEVQRKTTYVPKPQRAENMLNNTEKKAA